MSLKNNIYKIIQREAEIEQLLVNSFNLKPSELVELSKELSDIKPVTDLAKKKDVVLQELLDLSEILNDNEADDDIKKVALSEFEFLKEEISILERDIQFALLPKDKDDDKNAIVEIRAGTGGLEASLFCADLFRMYEKVCTKKKWVMEIISISKSEAGGLKEVVALIKGLNIYSLLKYESGVHRVQRVPDTETQGRVHTSAATVAVLPEAEDFDVKIEDKDLRIDVFRSSGPGGQSVNTTDSAVRITHIPTGIVAVSYTHLTLPTNREV